MRRSALTLEAELAEEELSLLLSLLRERRFSGPHLEIGTAAGGTLCKLIGSYPPQASPKFVVIDPMTYFPRQLEAIKENFARHRLDPEKVDFRIKKSAEAFKESRGERFDFIFIDGCHKAGRVMQDLRWCRFLNPGGLLCLHDYSPKYPGVYLTVNRFLSRSPHYERLSLTGKLLCLAKRAPEKREVSLADQIWAWSLSPLLQLRASLKKRLF